VPKIERVDRLYIVVAVEEHARRLAISAVCALADDDWMPGGRAQARIKAETIQIGRDVLGGLAAMRGIGRVRRNRLDLQQREQPIDAGIEFAVDSSQDGFDIVYAHDHTITINAALS
jgi:hypothetical protein